MNVDDWAFDKLWNNADIRAIVGDRINPDFSEFDSRVPAVVVSIVGCEQEYNLQGKNRQALYSIQLDSWATTYRVNADLRNLIRDEFEVATDEHCQVSKLTLLESVPDETNGTYNSVMQFDVLFTA